MHVIEPDRMSINLDIISWNIVIIILLRHQVDYRCRNWTWHLAIDITYRAMSAIMDEDMDVEDLEMKYEGFK